jgi:hypothetical protein
MRKKKYDVLAESINMLLSDIKSSGSTDKKFYAMLEDRELFDELLLIASNDGDSYRKRDVLGAVKKASDYYLTMAMKELLADLKDERPRVVAELKKRWKK